MTDSDGCLQGCFQGFLLLILFVVPIWIVLHFIIKFW
jgi:hypothetical protein